MPPKEEEEKIDIIACAHLAMRGMLDETIT